MKLEGESRASKAAQSSRSCPEAMGKAQSHIVTSHGECLDFHSAKAKSTVEAAPSFAVPSLQQSKSCYHDDDPMISIFSLPLISAREIWLQHERPFVWASAAQDSTYVFQEVQAFCCCRTSAEEVRGDDIEDLLHSLQIQTQGPDCSG